MSRVGRAAWSELFAQAVGLPPMHPRASTGGCTGVIVADGAEERVGPGAVPRRGVTGLPSVAAEFLAVGQGRLQRHPRPPLTVIQVDQRPIVVVMAFGFLSTVCR